MQARILHMPPALGREFIFLEENKVPMVVQQYKDRLYLEHKVLEIEKKDAEAAAEECFDLTNNPGRQEERERRYGRGRSVSVGDIIEVHEDRPGGEPCRVSAYLCMSFGWKKL